MIERMTSNTLLAKAIRIVLVFTLVFWASFQVEGLAFAKVVVDDGSGHADGTLLRMDVGGFTEIESGAIKDWRVLRTTEETAKGENDYKLTMGLEGESSTVNLAATAIWDTTEENEHAGDEHFLDFVEWSSDSDAVAVSEPRDGIVKLEAKKAGSAKITCKLKEGKEGLVTETFKKLYPGKTFEVTFTVEVKDSAAISYEVKSVEILNPEGAVCSGEQELALAKEQWDPYAFSVKVGVKVVGDESADLLEFNSANGSLKEQSGGILEDPTWELLAWDPNSADESVEESVAKIDPDGVLHVYKDSRFRVQCLISCSGAKAPGEVKVVAGNPQEEGGDEGGGDDQGKTPERYEQGDNNPQNELHVTVEGDAANASTGNSQPIKERVYTTGQLEALTTQTATYSMYDGKDYTTVTGRGPTLQSLLSDMQITNTDQIDSIMFKNANGTETTIPWAKLASQQSTPRADQGDHATDAQSEPLIAIESYVHQPPAGADGSGENGGSTSEPGTTDKPDGTGEPGAGGGSTSTDSPGGSTTNTPGTGSDATTPAPGGETAAGDNAQGGGSSTPEQGGTESQELLPNTRFRVLINTAQSSGTAQPSAPDINPYDLRWVNKIQINLKKAPSVHGVYIDYIPVPLGAQANLSAVPSNSVGSSHFNFLWQEYIGEKGDVSKDDSTKWKTIRDGVQTYSFPMTEEDVGRVIRVVLQVDTEEKKPENAPDDWKSYEEIVSEPVTIENGEGPIVTLAYDPPVAGNVAIFQSSIYGDVDMSTVKYTWEKFVGDSRTPEVLPGFSGPSLSVPTDPIDPKASESATSKEPTPVIYVRVRVTGKRSNGSAFDIYSNRQAFTVRDPSRMSDPGNSGKPGAPDNQAPSDPGNSSSGTNDGLPTQHSDSNSSGNATTTPRVTEIPSVSYETSVDPSTSGNTQPSSSSEVYINPEKSAEITEQVEAVQEYKNERTLGGRWTELSALDKGGQDTRRVLSSNPFAPLLLPFVLGMTAAGAVERILAFRRQVK